MARRRRRAGDQGSRRPGDPFLPPSEDLEELLRQLEQHDPRVLELALRTVLAPDGAPAYDDSPAGRAQAVLDKGLTSPSRKGQRKLAQEALAIWPDCADAYVLLAQAADSPEAALAAYRGALAAGERALGGPEGLQRYAGRFWGALETRPYLRARFELAEALWEQGQAAEAVTHCQELLRLNPGDNQGVRYVLASYCSVLNRDDDLERLLDQYPDDIRAEWSFSRALLAFRREGDSPAARKLLHEAHRGNRHVADYLLGGRDISRQPPPFIEPGGASEAVHYAGRFIGGWRATPGAISWMRSVLGVAVSAGPPPTPPAVDALLAEVAELPQNEEEVWQVDVRRSGLAAEPGEAPEGRWTFMVVNPATAGILTLEGFEDERPSLREMLSLLLQGMLYPHEPPARRPALIEVRRKRCADAWRPKLDRVGIACAVERKLPEFDLVMERLEQLGGGLRPPLSALHGREPELAELPQTPGEVWQADIRQLPTWIAEEGPPQRPSVSLVVNCTESTIVGQDMRMEQPAAEWLWDALLRSLFTPAVGAPHRPEVVEVVSPEFRELLQRHLEPVGVRCVIRDDLGFLDQIFGELSRTLAAEDQMPALVDTPGVAPKLVGDLYAAAADFYRLKPWRSVPGDTVIHIRCPKFQTATWYAVVMGQQGLTLGLALYEDLKVLRAMLDDKPDAQRRNSGLSLMFSEPFEIAACDLEAIERHGWPIAGPEAYPFVIRVNPGLATRTPLAWELELMIGCLRAIPAFLKRPDRTPARMVIPVLDGELDLEVSFLK